MRRDDNSVYGGNTTGRIGYGYEMRRGLKLRALAGTTLPRADLQRPVLSGLRRRDRSQPGARPQRRGRRRAGNGRRRALSATVYRNRVRDLIGYEPDSQRFCPPDPATTSAAPRNVGRARLQGATLAGVAALGRARACAASVDLLDATRRRHRRAPDAPRRAPGERWRSTTTPGAGASARRASSSARAPTRGVVLGGYGVARPARRLALPAAVAARGASC